jgi:hypothetical protein
MCSLPCATCTPNNPTVCTSCIAGYSYQSSSNICNPITSCQGACSVCPIGYNLIEGLCEQCFIDNCQLCSFVLNTCLICNYGYYLNVTSSSCSLCPTGCSSCTSSQLCTACSSGYTYANPMII